MIALPPTTLDQAIVTAALPKVVGQLPGSDRMAWVVTACPLASAVALPVRRKRGELFWRQTVLQLAIVTFVLGSAPAGWSRRMDELIAFRGPQGIGADGVMIGVQMIIADIVLLCPCGRYVGLIGAVFGPVPVAVPLIGDYVTDNASRRWFFYVNVPLGLVPLAAVGEVLSLPRPAVRRRFGALGTLPLTCGSACLVLLTSWGGSLYARHPNVILGPSLGALGVFVAPVTAGHLIGRSGRHGVHPVLGVSTVLLAAQNAAGPADFGASTAADNSSRRTGGSVGTAVFGTLFAERPRPRPAAELPRSARPPDHDAITPQRVRARPASLRDGCVRTYADAMPDVFDYAVPVPVPGLQITCFPKETPPMMSNGPARVPDTASTVTVPGARTAPGLDAAVCGTVRRADGGGIARAALTLIDAAGHQVSREVTGDEGRYALAAPGPGAYVLIAAAGGHQPRAVSVTVTDQPADLDVVLGGAARLAGIVRTFEGIPVPDAVVTLTDVRGDVVAAARSDRDGSYALAELVAGDYTLAAVAPAFRPVALPVSMQASRETVQDVELAGGAVLRGAVRAPGGRLVEDARVTLLDAAGGVVRSVITGADGVFCFVDMAAGPYTVVASGYPPVATVLQVAAGGRTERDVQLGHEE